MVKNKKTVLAYFLCGAVLFAVLGAFCMFLALMSDYSPELGYFDKGSVKAGLLYAVLAAGVIFAAVSWLIFRKSALENTDIPAPMYTKIVSGVLIITLLWRVGTDFPHIFSAGSELPQYYGGHPLPYWILFVASNLFALLFIASLVCSIASKRIRQRSLAVGLGFFQPLYAAVQLFIIYLDANTATNSPVKIIHQLTYISFMLFLTGAVGLSLGRSSSFPRYIFSLICTVIIGGTVSVSAILGLITDIPGVNMEPSQIVFCLAMTAYALCQLMTLALSDSVVLKSAEEDTE